MKNKTKKSGEKNITKRKCSVMSWTLTYQKSRRRVIKQLNTSKS